VPFSGPARQGGDKPKGAPKPLSQKALLGAWQAKGNAEALRLTFDKAKVTVRTSTIRDGQTIVEIKLCHYRIHGSQVLLEAPQGAPVGAAELTAEGDLRLLLPQGGQIFPKGLKAVLRRVKKKAP
jgi:hypothetical protein